MKGYPDKYYYGSSKTYEGRHIGDWAKNLKLACAGYWLVGKGFVLTFSCWADSYYTNPQINVWTEKQPKFWELKRHAEEYLHTYFTTKTKKQVFADIVKTARKEIKMKASS